MWLPEAGSSNPSTAENELLDRTAHYGDTHVQTNWEWGLTTLPLKPVHIQHGRVLRTQVAPPV